MAKYLRALLYSSYVILPVISGIILNDQRTKKTNHLRNSDILNIRSVSAVIHLDTNIRNMTHFWKSTGFCPPSPHTAAWRWFGSESMTQNLLYIGALPFQAIEQVRMHWLLDLITVSHGIYNFKALDVLLDRLHLSGLRPGFELMGNPGGLFTNLEEPNQVVLWRNLVHTVAKHYIDRYGRDYVSTWNFETWNEPKVGHFDKLNITLRGFLNYYDACAAGLRLASPGLRLGGPGGECKKYRTNHYCWALLDHIQNGRDFFNGQPVYKPDFISLHKKGEEPDNTARMLQKEETTIQDIHSHFPNLSQVPIFNDEADPLVGWSKPKWWRADATYAAMVAKVIVEHHKKWFEQESTVKFAMLSNDNGFLSYQPEVFTQRTLLARFQDNTTQSPGVYMVAKPAYSVMALLAFLGKQQQKVVIKGGDIDPVVGILTTYQNASIKDPHQSEEWSILIYNSDDTHNSTTTADVTLTFTGLTLQQNTQVSIFQIDNVHGNPYQKWIDLGRPHQPNLQQLLSMHKAELLHRVLGPENFTQQLVRVRIPQPGVSLVQICSKPLKPPQKVISLRVHVINDMQGLLIWDDSTITTRCLLTYHIQYSGQKHTFKRINNIPVLFNYFVIQKGHHVKSISGYYRVRAVDLWRRKGPQTTIVFP